MKIPLYSQLKAKLESKGLDSITSGQIAWFVASLFYAAICGFVIFCIMVYSDHLGRAVKSSFFYMLLVGFFLSLFSRYTFSLILYSFLTMCALLFIFLIVGEFIYVFIVLLAIFLVAIVNLLFAKQERTSTFLFILSLFIQYGIIYLFFNLMLSGGK